MRRLADKGILLACGLSNMAERVEAYRGTFRIDRDAGFKLFISIPKEGVRP